MAVIEPNGPALALFGVTFAAWCWSFLALAGLFPPSARPQSLAGAAGHVLVLLNVALSIVLLTGVALLAHQALRWTSVVVFGGLIFLFVPSTFQAVPNEWRDTRSGLAALGLVQLTSLTLLLSLSHGFDGS